VPSFIFLVIFKNNASESPAFYILNFIHRHAFDKDKIDLNYMKRAYKYIYTEA
jgi:hypothetical protein